MHQRARATDKRLLIVQHGHGTNLLAYRDQGPRVLAAMHRFIADHAGR
jgi:hypothetical protein